MSNHHRDLLGAYALGALESEEVADVERLIAIDAAARREVTEHLQVVELLGAMSQAQPSDDLWGRVAEEIAQPEDELAALRSARTSSPARWMPMAVAAVLVLVLGSVAVLQNMRIDNLSAEVAGLEAAAENPLQIAADYASANAFETVTLRTDATPDVDMTIVVMEDGRAYVTSSGLSPLSDDRTYQLWAIMDDERIISAAVLGNDPGVDTFVVDLDGLVGFAVTEEIDGGVVTSENPAVVVGLIDA